MYQEELDQIEDGLRRLKVEYDIFLNGHRKKPPEDLRMRVERLVKQLSEAGMTYQERFRYNTLVSRFYVYRDLWRRSIAGREMGRNGREAAPPLKAVKKVQETPAILTVSIGDTQSEQTKVRQLYNAMIRLKAGKSADKPPISYAQFERYIEKQSRDIRARYSCDRVRFTISADKDAVRFTAIAEQRNRESGSFPAPPES